VTRARLAAALVALAVHASPLCAQDLTGNWIGAFVRAGGAQPVTAEVARQGDSLRLALTFADRPTGQRLLTAPLRRDSLGRYTFATPYGPALAALDTAVRELVGTVGADSLGMRVHLKRTVPPPTHGVAREAIRIASGRVALPGTIFRPAGVERPAAAIFVQGRGCGPVGGLERQAELLAGHGIAALVYDKRGADTLVRPCATATIPDLAEDVVAAAEYLAARGDVDPARIGAIGWSAGGWVVARASERARRPLAFLALMVGPSTSVERQQVGSTAALARLLRLAPADSTMAMRYMELTFARGDRAGRYAEMQRILEAGRRVGWVPNILEPDDVPGSVAGMDSLWAVRNAYDPGPALRRFRGPVLALYGGADPVVPADENAARLRALAAEARNERVRAAIVPGAGHGLEQRDELRTVRVGPRELSYWHSRRSAPQLMDELLAFLRREGMLPNAAP